MQSILLAATFSIVLGQQAPAPSPGALQGSGAQSSGTQGSPTRPRTAAEAEAEALLDLTWQAFGPAEALEALGTVRMKGRAKALTSSFAGPFEELYHSDGRAVQRIDFEGSDPVYFGVDGRVSWEAWSDQGFAKFDWHAASDHRRFFLHRHAATPGRRAPGATAPWRALYSNAAVGGRAELDGRPCVRLVLTPRTARELGLAEVADRGMPEPDVLWIDAATHLPVRLETEMLRPADGEIRMKETFRDWREVEGVMFPMQRRLEVPGAGLDFVIESVEARVAVTGATFDLPPSLTNTLLQQHPHAVRLRDPEWRVMDHAALRTFAVRRTVPRAELEAATVGLRDELLALLTSESVALTDAPFGRWTPAQGGEVTVEVLAPVAADAMLSEARRGAVATVELPAGLWVEGTHPGPYARLGESVLSLDHYVRSQGLSSLDAPIVSLVIDLSGESSSWYGVVRQPVEPRRE